MAYNATYSESDLGPAIINGLTSVVLFIGGMAVIVGLVVLYNLMRTGKIQLKR